MKTFLAFTLIFYTSIAPEKCSQPVRQATAVPRATPSPSVEETTAQKPMEREMEVKLNKPASFTDTVNGKSRRVNLELRNVEDSRCPANARCIRAGEAKVTFAFCAVEMNATCKAQTFDLYVTSEPESPERKHEITIGAYNIELQGLEPNPVAGQETKLKDYVTGVRISRN